MSDRIFVDTNILVYRRDASELKKQQISEDWLQRLWKERSGRLSVQVLSEYFVTVTQKLEPGLEPGEAWQDIRDLMAWSPEPVDAGLARDAYPIFAHYSLSWWDSMIIAAAKRAKCTTILSEDLSDNQDYGGLRVINPF